MTLDGVLAIVPARGGSVGVRRKNTRLLAGRPLVLQRLDTLRDAGLVHIVCSTDDPTIASIARMAGFDVHRRQRTAGPDATIADTATEVVADLGWRGPVAVFQCTSPGLGAERIRYELESFLADPTIHTAATVTTIHDVAWDEQGHHFGEWVNRQTSRPSLWRETGGMRLVRDPTILPVMVDMDGHHLIELTGTEAADIDTHPDLAAARLPSVPLVFMTAVGHQIGSGHLRRCLTLADELAHHDVRFRLIHHDDTPDLSWTRLVAQSGYSTLDDAWPGHYSNALVVLDVLATNPANVWSIQTMGHRVVVLEDDGPGSLLADLVINELLDGEHSGPDFAVIRPEFLTGRRHAPSWEDAEGTRVLVCFGGTDPSGTGSRVADLLAGAGWDVTRYSNVDLAEEVPLAEAMASHHLLVSSCGRVLHEAACLGIPTIGIPVNVREEFHRHVPSSRVLPRCEFVTDDEILHAVKVVLTNPALRREMSSSGQSLVDGLGTQRISRMIDDLARGI